MTLTIKEIRLFNARYLADSVGGISRLAERIDRAQTQISSLIGKTPRKGIGSALARHIETEFTKPRGWLDSPQPRAWSLIRDPSWRDEAVQASKRITERFSGENFSTGPQIYGRFPVISWVQAGNWEEIVDNFSPGDADEWLACPVNCGPRTFVLRVEGVSMEPTFRAGEYIYVDPDVRAENGSYVVVRLDNDGKATFKKLVFEGGKRYLKAENSAWPTPIIEITDDATICGVVRFKGVAL